MTTRYRDKVRGTNYRVLFEAAKMSSSRTFDQMVVVVYQSEADNSVWVRPTAEFHGGQFELLSADAEPAALFLPTEHLDGLFEKADKTNVGVVVKQLVNEIRHHRRQVRADVSLAKQLGASIARNSVLQNEIDDLRKSKP